MWSFYDSSIYWDIWESVKSCINCVGRLCIVVSIDGGLLRIGNGCCSHILNNLEELMFMARESFIITYGGLGLIIKGQNMYKGYCWSSQQCYLRYERCIIMWLSEWIMWCMYWRKFSCRWVNLFFRLVVPFVKYWFFLGLHDVGKFLMRCGRGVGLGSMSPKIMRRNFMLIWNMWCEREYFCEKHPI